MAAGHDGDAGAGRDLGKSGREVVLDAHRPDALGVSIGLEELRSIVHHRDLEIEPRGQPGDFTSDVPAAEDEQRQRRTDDLDQDAGAAAAHHAGRALALLREAVLLLAALAGAESLPGVLDHQRLERAAADAEPGPAAPGDDHPAAGSARRRTLAEDDVAGAQQPDDLLVELQGHVSVSRRASSGSPATSAPRPPGAARTPGRSAGGACRERPGGCPRWRSSVARSGTGSRPAP